MSNLDIDIVFWILLAVFTAGASIQAGVTLLNVLRLRNVRMSWKAGKMRGYPLFSTIFLGVTAVMAGLSLYQNSTTDLIAASFYLMLGLAWFTTSFLTSKRYVTDHGIAKNVNEPSQTVAWHQIRDFVERENKDGIKFIFIYTETGKGSACKVVQLELLVPYRKIYNFRKLISHKLGRRISCYTNETIKVEQFE